MTDALTISGRSVGNRGTLPKRIQRGIRTMTYARRLTISWTLSGIRGAVGIGRKALASAAEWSFMIPNSKRHRVDCGCVDCKLLRVTYALVVANNHRDLEPGDMEWALVILSHSNMMEDL